MTVGVGIYTGGDPYEPNAPYSGSLTQQLFNQIASAGYNSVVIWAAHVDSSGDITINDSPKGHPTVQGGHLSDKARDWAEQVKGLKEAKGTTITRLELSLGGDQTSFANINTLINSYGVGASNPFYNNLKTLNAALGLDAINYDDEGDANGNYYFESCAQLATMCYDLGMKVSICPYTQEANWIKLVSEVNKAHDGQIDAVYVQCYSTLGINPVPWNEQFKKQTGLTVAPGLNSPSPQSKSLSSPDCSGGITASNVQDQIATWSKQTSLDGAWMFLGTAILKCSNAKEADTLAEYATAMSNGLSGSSSQSKATPAGR